MLKVISKELRAKVLAKIETLTKEHVAEKKFATAAVEQYGSELAGDVFDKAKNLGEKIALLYQVLDGTLNLDAIELTEAQLRVAEDELAKKQEEVTSKKTLLARLKKAKELI